MGISPGAPVKAAKSKGCGPSHCRADCPGTQRPAHPPSACPGVLAVWLPAAALLLIRKCSSSATDLQRPANDAKGHTLLPPVPVGGSAMVRSADLAGTFCGDPDAPIADLLIAASQLTASTR